jgi:hypothetical protein
MPEPTSTGVAGAAALRAAGGVAAGDALLAIIGVISTVATGIGGAISVQDCRRPEWVEAVNWLVALGGLTFGCGL